MRGLFDLPVLHEGVEAAYPAELVCFGYMYKFIVAVDGHALIFETDDEGAFRVIGERGKVRVDTNLLRSIIASLEYLTSR